MKIAIVGSRGIPGQYGGFETFSEKLSVGLTELGYDVTVVCPHDQAYREPTYKGVILEYIYHPKGMLGSLVYDGIALWKISRKNYDIILLLGYASSPFCIIPRFFGCKVIINTNGMEWRRGKWPWYGKLWLRLTEKVAVWIASSLVSDSKGIARYYKERHNADSFFIPYGTEILSDLGAESLQGYALKPDGYYIVVMRMEPENSILEIVEGLLKAKTTRLLVLVGSPTPFFESRVLPLLKKNEDKIRYLGTIYDRDKLFQLRQNAFAYIHGHTVGGTNPSLLEAMSSRDLVIARDINFNREVLEDIGYYFTSAADLSQIIATLEMTPTSVITQKKQAAKERILSYYTWDRISKAYDALFRSLING